MEKFFLKLRKPYILIYSFFINLEYWYLPFLRYAQARRRRKEWAGRILGIGDVEMLMGHFAWTKDRRRDWRPWVITIFCRMFEDDCDGASVLGKWALLQMNEPRASDIVSLWKQGEMTGHAVCVTKDRKKMISNNDVVTLTGVFPANVYAHFDGAYDSFTITS